MLAEQSPLYIVDTSGFHIKMWEILVFLTRSPYTAEDLHFLQGGAYKLQEFQPNPSDMRKSL
jgi:hypothetical protein